LRLIGDIINLGGGGSEEASSSHSGSDTGRLADTSPSDNEVASSVNETDSPDSASATITITMTPVLSTDE